MKDLEKENLRLRRAIFDRTLDTSILEEAARGNLKPRAATAVHRSVASRAAGVRAANMRVLGLSGVSTGEAD